MRRKRPQLTLINLYAVNDDTDGTLIYKDKECKEFYCHWPYKRFRVPQIVTLNCWNWNLIPVKNEILLHTKRM